MSSHGPKASSYYSRGSMRIYVISLPFSGVSSTLCGIRRGVFRRPFTINFFHQDTQAWCWKGQGRAASARRPCGCSLPAQSVSTGVPSGSFYASCLGALGFVCELIWCFFCFFGFFLFLFCFLFFFFSPLVLSSRRNDASARALTHF